MSNNNLGKLWSKKKIAFSCRSEELILRNNDNKQANTHTHTKKKKRKEIGK